MSSGLDKSLDDMIKAKPRSQRRRRVPPTAKAAVLGASNVGAGAAVKAATRAAALPTPAKSNEPTVTQAQQQAQKIVVSNLPLDVTEQQIKELFASTVGKTREATLAYNAKGQSKGIAHVTFFNKGDGFKAYKEYNNRLIDASQSLSMLSGS
ncbi:hypothetical protein CALVIDRAFT_484559 [Calocera viscosa TUFC12733]|uniref:RRM domain-containing protein n=1 Tax=Calocera viscosa (strain TUFC12733) TaxID=1330018 RepID=A0A167K114_CALVF|nr:hypothetical protein CALVIDRAFT_484559 [Calocera viscosa TUFC12733]